MIFNKFKTFFFNIKGKKQKKKKIEKEKNRKGKKQTKKIIQPITSIIHFKN